MVFYFPVRLLIMIWMPDFKMVIESGSYPKKKKKKIILFQIVQVWTESGSSSIAIRTHTLDICIRTHGCMHAFLSTS